MPNYYNAGGAFARFPRAALLLVLRCTIDAGCSGSSVEMGIARFLGTILLVRGFYAVQCRRYFPSRTRYEVLDPPPPLFTASPPVPLHCMPTS